MMKNDKTLLEIIKTEKNAHKHLLNSRDSMKCDIGNDQKPYKADLSQVNNTCKHLNQKDQTLYKELSPDYDRVTTEYLAN